MNIESPEYDEDEPVNLGPSCINYAESDAQMASYGQKEILDTFGILRPKEYTGHYNSQSDCRMREGEFGSEFGKNLQFMIPAGEVQTRKNDGYFVLCSDDVQKQC